MWGRFMVQKSGAPYQFFQISCDADGKEGGRRKNILMMVSNRRGDLLIPMSLLSDGGLQRELDFYARKYGIRLTSKDDVLRTAGGSYWPRPYGDRNEIEIKDLLNLPPNFQQ